MFSYIIPKSVTKFNVNVQIISKYKFIVTRPFHDRINRNVAKNCSIIRPNKQYYINQTEHCRFYGKQYDNLLTKENLTRQTLAATHILGSEQKSQPQDPLSLLENSTSEELSKLDAQFPAPKATLHNYYQMVSHELKATNLILSQPQYKIIPGKKKEKSSWSCVYKLTWPEEIRIDATGATKQVASKRAAAKALNWLRRNGKLTKQGCPIIYNKDDADLSTKPVPVNIDYESAQGLQTIIDIYKDHLEESITKSSAIELAHEDGFPNQVSANHFPILKRSMRNVHTRFSPLPIAEYREEIIDAIEKNQTVIIKGEPGCGKSTQVVQYILDDCIENGNGKCRITVSQPRRLAAISLAEWVAKELNERIGQTVGYQVRLDTVFNQKTGAILYCTSGILLKQLQSDPALLSLTHVILDEAHERDVNTDMLLILLRKALTLNPNLKLLVMSATIDVKLFQSYFNNAPAVHIPGFTYPVKSYFLDDIELNLHKSRENSEQRFPSVDSEEVCNVIEWIDQTKDEGAILCFLPGWDDISKVRKILEEKLDRNAHLVLPLHSRLSTTLQRQIFSRPPPGVRKIILATNIAETSVTIDDVVYVVDCGTHKEKRLEKEQGQECVDNYWISKSSVDQRRGRAGRVRPGESYHLFTKDRYEQLNQYAMPEVLRISLTDLILKSKVYSPNMLALDFLNQLPNPPKREAIENAIKELVILSILDEREKLTALGKTVAHYSLPPSLSKSLVYSYLFNCVSPIVDIVTFLNADTEIFMSALIDKPAIRAIKRECSENSDHIAYTVLLDEWREKSNQRNNSVAKWCSRYQINGRKMLLLQRLRDVHWGYLEKLVHGMEISDRYSENDELIKAVLLAGVNNILRQKNIVKGRYKKRTILATEYGQPATISSGSVNSKAKIRPTMLYLYSNESHSLIRRMTTIRETSVISPLAVLLFKNYTPQIMPSNEESGFVVINDSDSKLQFLCEEDHANKLLEVKNILDKMAEFFLNSLHQSKAVDRVIISDWTAILSELDNILARSSTTKY